MEGEGSAFDDDWEGLDARIWAASSWRWRWASRMASMSAQRLLKAVETFF